MGRVSTFSCAAAITETSTSGKVVAILTMVAPMISLGIPLLSAIHVEASTKKSPPLMIRSIPRANSKIVVTSSILISSRFRITKDPSMADKPYMGLSYERSKLHVPLKPYMSLANESKPDQNSQYVDLLRHRRLLLPHGYFVLFIEPHFFQKVNIVRQKIFIGLRDMAFPMTKECGSKVRVMHPCL